MLDGPRTGAGGRDRARRAVRMGHHVDPQRGRLVDDRLELLVRERAPLRAVTRRGQVPCREHLDHVGTRCDVLADLGAEGVRSVGHRVRDPRVGHPHVHARGGPSVVRAAGRAELHQRREQAGAVDEALGQRRFYAASAPAASRTVVTPAARVTRSSGIARRA